MEAKCDNCRYLSKVKEGTDQELWICHEYSFHHSEMVDKKSAPVICSPPDNNPCKLYANKEEDF